VIRVRPFRNTDPPYLVEVWRSQPPLRGLAQPISVRHLEELVFSKPYFDREGLLVAESDEGTIVGFVHAGFGATDDLSSLSTEMGAICLLLVADGQPYEAVAAPLMHAAESYLRRRGAKLLYAGGVFPLNPFYLGLYGGSEMPGVLESDGRLLEFFQHHEYEPISSISVLQRSLTGFRPLVDRGQMQIRRSYQIEAVLDPPAQNWWEACTFGHTDRTRFDLYPRGSRERAATVTFWHIEPLASSWGVHAVGMINLETAPALRRKGLATFLVGESLRQLQTHGVTLVEAQTLEQNIAAQGLYRKLGFEAVDRGIVLRKASSGV